MNKVATLSAGAKGRAFSPVRALIWKEWRQQRLVFLLLFVLAYSLAVAGLFGEGDMRRMVPRILAGLVGVAAILILSANAFAGERDENSESFLEMIPHSRKSIFWVKLGSVFALAVLGLVPLGVWYLSFAARIHAEGVPLAAFTQAAIITPAGLVLLAIVPALIASCGGSVITVVLISIPVAAGCLLWDSFAAKRWGWFYPIPNETSFLLLMSVLVVGTLLLAARRLWSRRERTRRSSAATLMVTAGLIIAYGVVPMVAAYLYVTCLAPLNLFMGHAPIAEGWVPGVSPTGKFIAVDATYRGWGEDKSRAALVNVETGRAQWFTRFRPSGYVWRTPRLWSPAGGSFVLTEWDDVLCPLKSRSDWHGTFYKVDVRSGTRQSFDELCPGLRKIIPEIGLPLVGWYSEEVFAFQDVRDIYFADTERHTVQRCMKPAAFLNSGYRNPFRMPITRRGIFEAVNREQLSQEELRLFRYAPELAEAEVLRITLPPAAVTSETDDQNWPPILVGLTGASQDGECLLLHASNDGGTSYQYYITRAQDGAQAALLVSSNPDEKGLLAASWRATGFLPALPALSAAEGSAAEGSAAEGSAAEGSVTEGSGVEGPGGRQILLYRNEPQGLHVVDSEEKMGFDSEIGLFNADNQNLRRIPLAVNGRQIDSVAPSPKGGFALVGLSAGPSRDVYSWVVLRLSAPWEIVATMESGRDYRWLGEDRLLFEEGGKPYVINRDGTGKRPLLSEK